MKFFQPNTGTKIAFDIGNVLVNVDLNLMAELLCETECVKSRAEAFLFWDSINSAVDIGITDIEQELMKEFKLKSGDEIRDYMRIWSKVITPVKEMTELLEELVSKNFHIALLSNIGFDHANLVRKTFPSVFNKCIHHFSCEVGARKPSKLFFQSFLWDHPEFKGCLFFDDRSENIAAGLSAGFDSIYFALNQKNNNKSAARELLKIVLDDSIKVWQANLSRESITITGD